MVGIEFLDPHTGSPLRELVARITRGCYENGLIMLSSGMHGNTLRFLTPLVITDAQLDEGLDILSAVMRQVISG